VCVCVSGQRRSTQLKRPPPIEGRRKGRHDSRAPIVKRASALRAVWLAVACECVHRVGVLLWERLPQPQQQQTMEKSGVGGWTTGKSPREKVKQNPPDKRSWLTPKKTSKKDKVKMEETNGLLKPRQGWSGLNEATTKTKADQNIPPETRTEQGS